MSREMKFRDYDLELKQMRYFDMDSYEKIEELYKAYKSLQ